MHVGTTVRPARQGWHSARGNVFFLLALGVVFALFPEAAQQVPTRILFVGNSLTFWNDGLYFHLERLAASARPPIAVATGRSVVPGAFLKSLWARPEPRREIGAGRYDVVVLQEDLPETTVQDFLEHARLFVAEARKAGVRPVLLMAWAYDRLGWITLDEIARAHRAAAAELKVDVAPVGLAWQRASELRPDLNLYAPDREHPSIHGTYLATAVVYAAVLKRNPTGLSYAPAGIAAKDAQLLQSVAWEAVQSNQ
jgi:hypothetical protein